MQSNYRSGSDPAFDNLFKNSTDSRLFDTDECNELFLKLDAFTKSKSVQYPKLEKLQLRYSMNRWIVLVHLLACYEALNFPDKVTENY